MVVVRGFVCGHCDRYHLHSDYFLVWDAVTQTMVVSHLDGFAFLGIPAGFLIPWDALEELASRTYFPHVTPGELARYNETFGILVFPKLDAKVMNTSSGLVPLRDLDPEEAYKVFIQLTSDYFSEC